MEESGESQAGRSWAVAGASGDVRRQRAEQYFTWSQSRAHFLRHANGRSQVAHRLVGSSDFLRMFMAVAAPVARQAKTTSLAPISAGRRLVRRGLPCTG